MEPVADAPRAGGSRHCSRLYRRGGFRIRFSREANCLTDTYAYQSPATLDKKAAWCQRCTAGNWLIKREDDSDVELPVDVCLHLTPSRMLLIIVTSIRKFRVASRGRPHGASVVRPVTG